MQQKLQGAGNAGPISAELIATGLLEPLRYHVAPLVELVHATNGDADGSSRFSPDTLEAFDGIFSEMEERVQAIAEALNRERLRVGNAPAGVASAAAQPYSIAGYPLDWPADTPVSASAVHAYYGLAPYGAVARLAQERDGGDVSLTGEEVNAFRHAVERAEDAMNDVTRVCDFAHAVLTALLPHVPAAARSDVEVLRAALTPREILWTPNVSEVVR